MRERGADLEEARRSGTSINASPVVSADSNTLYVGSNNGITALDISHHDATDGTRTPRWTYPTAGYVGNTPALDSSSGTLYFGTQLGNIKTMYALNSVSGSLKPGWPIQVLSGSAYSPFPIVAADGTVYWGIDNGVRAYSPNGTLLWTFHTTNYVISSPIIGVTAGRPTLFVGSLDRKLYAISSPPRGGGTNHPPVAHASANPTTVIAGTQVAFNGSTSTDPDHNTLSYSWDFNDPGSGVNNTASIANPTHTYSTPNTYLASLTVSDGFLSDTDQVQVTVNPIQGGGGGTFTDDFNRCTTTSCDTLGGPSPQGPQWGEAKGNLEIKNGQLMINVDDPSTLKGDNIAVLPLNGATQAAEADFTSVNNSWGPRLGVVLRYQDAGNYYMLYRIAGGTVALRISKVVNGVETVLASKPIPPPVVIPPTAFHLRGTVSGNTLTVTLGPNEAPTATLNVTPASTLPSGSLGILLGASFVLPYSADNFAATAANP